MDKAFLRWKGKYHFRLNQLWCYMRRLWMLISILNGFYLEKISLEWNGVNSFQLDTIKHGGFNSRMLANFHYQSVDFGNRRLQTSSFQPSSSSARNQQKGTWIASSSRGRSSDHKLSSQAPSSGGGPADEVRRRVSITEVVGKYVKLKPSGENHLGCCPFHNDKTPSMSVSEDKGLYHCFSCGESGDVIKFVMGMEQMEWRDALQFLVDNYAPDVPLVSGKGSSPQQRARAKERQQHLNRVKECIAAAVEFYADQLMQTSAGAARGYLQERKLPPKMAVKFGLGLAPQPPKGGNARLLTDFLLGEGFTLAELVDAGLVIANKWSLGSKGGRTGPSTHAKQEEPGNVINLKTAIDRFRNRLMIPIRDTHGSVIAFGARALGKEQMPKYLNSPETPIFKKSKTLFGLDLAKDSIRHEGKVIVVEGYFDVMALHAKNVTNVVGVLGTAITAETLSIASSISNAKVIVNLDNDEAGKNALDKLCASEQFHKLSESGVDIQIATLPDDHKDPADYLQTASGEDYRSMVVGSAKSWTEWYGDLLLSDYKEGDPELFRRVVMRLTSFLSTLPAADRTFHCYKFAEKLSNGNTGLRLQLETDLMQLIRSKERTQHRNDQFVEDFKDLNSSLSKVSILSKLSSGETTIPDSTLNQQSVHENKQMVQEQVPHTGSNVVNPASKIKPKPKKPKDTNGNKQRNRWKEDYEKSPVYWQPVVDPGMVHDKQISRVLDEAELQLLLLLIHDPLNRQIFIEAISDHQLIFTSRDRQWLLNQIMTLPKHQLGVTAKELLQVMGNSTSDEAQKYFSSGTYLAKLFEDSELLEAMTKNSDILLQSTLTTVLKATAEAERKLLLRQFANITEHLHSLQKAHVNQSDLEPPLVSELSTNQTLIIEKVKRQTEIINDLNLKMKHFADRVFSIAYEQDIEKHMEQLMKLQSSKESELEEVIDDLTQMKKDDHGTSVTSETFSENETFLTENDLLGHTDRKIGPINRTEKGSTNICEGNSSIITPERGDVKNISIHVLQNTSKHASHCSSVDPSSPIVKNASHFGFEEFQLYAEEQGTASVEQQLVLLEQDSPYENQGEHPEYESTENMLDHLDESDGVFEFSDLNY